MGKLDGKVAIVTGSGRGIGAEIALKLAGDGAAVMVNDLDAGPAKETAAAIDPVTITARRTSASVVSQSVASCRSEKPFCFASRIKESPACSRLSRATWPTA